MNEYAFNRRAAQSEFSKIDRPAREDRPAGCMHYRRESAPLAKEDFTGPVCGSS